jgi:hypothetical protein
MYYQESDFTVVERAVELAKTRGVTPSQIALAWLLHQPGVTAPIVGASKMHHLEEDVAALDIELSAEELDTLEEPYQPHPVLGHPNLLHLYGFAYFFSGTASRAPLIESARGRFVFNYGTHPTRVSISSCL